MKHFKILSLGVLFLAFFNCNNAFSQFSHSLGSGFHFMNFNNDKLTVPNVFYSPNVTLFKFSNEISLSLGAQVGMGFRFSTNEYDNDYFVFDMPMVVELNFGYGSNKNSNAPIGGFIGGGYEINSLSYVGESYSTNGLIMSGGIRVNINNSLFGMRITYLKPKDNSRVSQILTIGLFYTIQRK